MNSQKVVTRLPATSIIEVLISAALIGTVLTALAINMIYTQRTLENTYLRTKALDVAQSCVNQFQAARDNNEWPLFCSRVAAGDWGSRVQEITYPTGGGIVCRATQDSFSGQKYEYLVSFNSNVTSACKGGRDANFTVTVRVYYNDALGNEKHVDVSKRFERGSMDAEYI